MQFRKNKNTLSILNRAGRMTCAILLVTSSLLIDLTLTDIAYCDVRKTDYIVSGTVEDRGLKAASCPSIECEYAYLIDSNGKVYFSRDADTETQIASITKVMTAVIALENAPLDTTIEVSQRAMAVGESSANLKAGDKLSLNEALKGLMIPSGNDCAIAIAESVGKLMQKESGISPYDIDNESGYNTFVDAMNEKAAELGCTSTVFTNPHGLDFGEHEGALHSTAKEVSIISEYAMQIDYFREIVDMPSADLPVERSGQNVTVKVETTDLLLGNYDGACGIKTGFTDRAGSCFSGACSRDGLTLYAVILDSTDDYQRFKDAEELYDWVYGNTYDFKLANSDETLSMEIDGKSQEVKVVANVALTAWLDKTVPATFANPDASVNIFALDGNVSQEFEFYDIGGGVSAGDIVGHATFYQDNEKIAEEDLIACEDVPAPGILEGVGIWWEKLTRSFSGQPNCAESIIINNMPLLINKN